jgi:hypothetical protein
MPFQEYHPQFPHVQYTVGYAGRPSGPGWYVSILDNSHNHGPGSQQNHNPHEADSLFGKLVNEHDDNDDSKENETILRMIIAMMTTMVTIIIVMGR